MFEGLLGNDLDIYVTTAANAIESSWATYCPTFFASTTDAADDMMSNGGSSATSAVETAAATAATGSDGGWRQQLLRGMAWLQQQLGRITGSPQPSSAAAAATAAAAAGGVKPSPEFTTCLGDLYSVAWMEDAEASDLTAETLLQQYKKIKVRGLPAPLPGLEFDGEYMCVFVWWLGGGASESQKHQTRVLPGP